jgi:hypothetical protein
MTFEDALLILQRLYRGKDKRLELYYISKIQMENENATKISTK